MTLAKELIKFAEPLYKDLTIKDVRIGLGYTCVELSDSSVGLAWTPGKNHSASCTHLNRAGSLLSLHAQELLLWLESDAHLERAIGLAVFNALNSRVNRKFIDLEAISQLGIKSSDHVVMVGYFAPLISRIKETSCKLEIVELDSKKPGVIDLRKGHIALSQCDVAIITSTSIINNSVDDLLSSLQKNRSAVMLGPSTPLCPEVFKNTRITQVSGALIMDTEKVKTIVSQSGGTMLLKKYLRFASEKV